MYKAEILADSLSPQGNRLTTMKITFPRFILAELNTHRMFSRNSASSRAIPFKKMVKMVEENPFIPIAWQRDHKGMQGTEYLEGTLADSCESDWLKSRDNAVLMAKSINHQGATKQLCNRLLEPFMWHTVIVTATEWENFFKLRCPQYHSPVDTHFRHRSKKDCIAAHSNPINLELFEKFTDLDWLKINESQAEIHIQAIAELMWDKINHSVPKQLQPGKWHIPFGDNIDIMELDHKLLWDETKTQDDREDIMENPLLEVKIATARCARISYETLGDDPKIDYEADIKLHDRLLAEGHMSPFEHCAIAMTDQEYYQFRNGWLDNTSDEVIKASAGWCRNFRGFIQYRHLIETNDSR